MDQSTVDIPVALCCVIMTKTFEWNSAYIICRFIGSMFAVKLGVISNIKCRDVFVLLL